MAMGIPVKGSEFYAPSALRAMRCSYSVNGYKQPFPVPDSRTFTAPEARNEDTGEGMVGLDGLLAPLKLTKVPSFTWLE